MDQGIRFAFRRNGEERVLECAGFQTVAQHARASSMSSAGARALTTSREPGKYRRHPRADCSGWKE